MRRGLGHSEPFGKRKHQGYPRSKVKSARRLPNNVGRSAVLRGEQAGVVKTRRGRRPRRSTVAHTGPYTPEHFARVQGKRTRVRPGGPAKEDD